ncbi:MlaD family protein [Patulibacter minatonensis]|uniref:MlaD family protein n=1 Tax=Patulibacter minatonensis TaxID=298163 RepID=UPI0004B22275|nr:MlaD family protein [Patulibacter minatonensis]
MRARLGLVAVLLAVVAGVVLVGVGRSNDARGADGRGDHYLVRAIFSNASFVIRGEDVKVAGVIAGKIERVELTPDNRAAVVIDITDRAYQDFRADATCRIGLQSLIGEQYVECTPTQRRGEGVVPAAPLQVVASGPGRGQRLLPVERTSSPVGPDLLANIMRVPQRERLRLIIGELGVGLAGGGTELRAAIERADPTLQQADRLVEILATQNRTIAGLVQKSDAALQPLAARRGDLSGFTSASARVGAAAAERGDALEQDLGKLPGFLAELRPAAGRIGALADQARPAVDALSARAPQLNTAVTRLGPFASAGTGALTSLGRVADQGRATFPKLDRLAAQLKSTGSTVVPVASQLADVGGSFDRTGGITNLLRTLHFYTGALNGKDGTSHYQRTTAYLSLCIERRPVQVGQCVAQFQKDATGATP